MPFRKEKKIPFYMQNLNKIFPLLLHLSLTAFTSCRKVTQSFSNPENCYDITRQLASFKAIKFTKRYGVSESVSEWVSYWQALPMIGQLTQLFQPFHNCYDITRQLASFKAIKFTKRHGVSQWVSDKHCQWSNSGPITKKFMGHTRVTLSDL